MIHNDVSIIDSCERLGPVAANIWRQSSQKAVGFLNHTKNWSD